MLLVLTCLFVNCGGDQVVHHDHDHDEGNGHHHHHHEPPHGGVPIVLGDEEYHLEFLIDNEKGIMMMYVMDAHMENFVRIASPEIVMKVTVGDKSADLKFIPQASNTTGESVGDTSLFIAEDEIIKELKEFEALIPEINIKTSTYSEVKFPFPEGNEPDEH